MHRRALVPAAALAVLLAGTGCTSSAPEEVSPTGTAPVVQLGAPGESNRVLGPDEVEDLADQSPEPSESDIAFVRDMVPHHQQALEMTALAESNGAGRDVRLLAERMRVSQTDEVAQLEQWLVDRGPLPPDDRGSARRRPRGPACPACSPTRRWRRSPRPAAPSSTASSSPR